MAGLSGLSGLSGPSGLIGGTYSGGVKSTEPAHLLAYWPLWEASGAVANDISGNGRNGAYTGVTLGQTGIGDGRTCPFFDGANDFVNVQTASLVAAFDGALGTIALWARVANAGVWTDGAIRYMIYLSVDGNNYVYIRKDNGANSVTVVYRAGGVIRIRSATTSAVTWQHFAVTWDAANDRLRVFMNGTQVGADVAGLGVWAGNLVSSVIGALNTTPNFAWHGWLAHVAIWDVALTPTQIAALATV